MMGEKLGREEREWENPFIYKMVSWKILKILKINFEKVDPECQPRHCYDM